MTAILKLNDTATKRIYGLDLIRAIAITLVLIDHSKFFFTPFYSKLNYLSVCGFFGVELFFVLSGFLIGGMLIKSYFSESRFGVRKLLNFWKRRWFRTLPNYFLILAVSALISREMLLSESVSLIRYGLFTQNLFHRIPAFFMESWSLSVEEWFYLLFPLTFVLLNFTSSVPAKKRLLLLLIVAMIICFSIVRLVFANAPSIVQWNLDVRQVVFYRLDAVGYGVLLAYFQYFYKEFLNRYRNLFMLLGMIMIITSIIMYVALFLNVLPELLANNLLFFLVSCGFSFIFPVMNGLKRTHWAWIKKKVVHLSLISYSVYLLNYGLILVPMLKMYEATNITTAAMYFIVFWVITILAATLLYRFYEYPMTNLRERFTFSKNAHLAK